MLSHNDKKLPRILRDYLNYNINLNKSNNTVQEYQYDLSRFLKYLKAAEMSKKDFDFDEIDISEIDINFIKKITSGDIYDYLSYLKTDLNNSATTRARKIASIKGFFRYLYAKMKLIDSNPASEIEVPKLKKTLPKYLSLTESQQLLSNAKAGNKKQFKKTPNLDKEMTSHQKYLSTRDYAIITLFLNCGMRLSELVGIDMSHIKFDESILTVTGKGNKQRTVYLNKACEHALNEYLKLRPVITGKDKDALFLSDRKKRISRRTVQVAISQYLEAAGLNGYSVHKLRHTAATLMYQNGVDVRALQEILGHENIGTTQIYTHVDNYQIRQAIENNPLADYDANE